jgi:RNA polymerase sigma factor (sigma-70 family)
MAPALEYINSVPLRPKRGGRHGIARLPTKGRPSDVDWAKSIEAIAVRADRSAFERLFAHFAPRVKGLMIRNGASPELAEEIAQETMLAVWRKASQFDPATTGVAAWIFTIARNLRIDWLRRSRVSVPLEQADYLAWEDDGPPPDLRLEAQQDHIRVTRALGRLSAEQARAIRESYYEEKPHGEIAAALDIPLGTVKSRLRLAIQHLRTILDDDNGH